jgi:hypothetical protein
MTIAQRQHTNQAGRGDESDASEDEILATARKALGDNEFAAAAAAGKSLTLEQAVADALS